MAVVQYDGTDYYGFQIQAGVDTIQGVLEEALSQVTQETTRIVGAGRTDTGVHARAQVISFKTNWRHSWAELQRALNAVLPEAIAVQTMRAVDEQFHARYSARARTYRYTINNSFVRAPLSDRFAWQVSSPLEATPMHLALQSCVGKHDFAAFGNAPEKGEHTVREVLAARCWRELEWVQIELRANAFLQGMVRRIVGTLVQVGLGRMTLDEFANSAQARDKTLVKWKAEPQGLCLWCVEY
jgi:tRNA pseudouridine38-40 synthase